MADNSENNDNRGRDNQRIGRELYQQNKAQQRHNQDWNAGNQFHTGPSSHGAQDRPEQTRGNDFTQNRNTAYNQGNNPYRNQPDSSYSYEQSSWANPRNRPDNDYDNRNRYARDGAQPGNYNDENAEQNDRWRESPDSRTRYKDDDYRYGSGSHNWYREGRYSPDHANSQQDPRGFFQRVKDGWNDIMQSDNPDYVSRSPNREPDRFDRERRGSEVFRDQNPNKGNRSGSRWTNESNSENDYY